MTRSAKTRVRRMLRYHKKHPNALRDYFAAIEVACWYALTRELFTSEVLPE